MFSKLSVSTLIAAVALAGVAHAEVTPSEPGPGQVFNAGSTCTVSWDGDKDSTTAWKDMAIQLMTGDNFAMVHLTTIATGEDGTIDGRVNYPCPEVNPNSNIYFYQFTAPGAANKTWTTRFTIASSTGQTTPPTNPTQPGTNDPVPWGTGALVDPSKAVAAPPSAGGTGVVTPPTGTATTTTGTATGSSTGTGTRATGTGTSTANSTATAGANSTAAAKTAADNGAVGSMSAGMMVGSVVAVASSALALALSL